jgi:hypothetical protein
MLTKHLSLRPAFLISFLFLSGCLFASCSFRLGEIDPLTIDCQVFENISITPLTAQESNTVFETPGTIIVIDGSGSAKVDSANTSDWTMKIEQSVVLPRWVNQATVFLNGWRLAYRGGDQHVYTLVTAIAKIRLSRVSMDLEPKLTWNAVSLIRDDDGEEGFDWTYRFTVVAWEDSNLNATVDHGIVDVNGKYCSPDGTISDNILVTTNVPAASNVDTDSALLNVSSFIQNNAFATSKPVVMLPRGFGFIWGDSDHHLLQVAYNLDHSETFVDKNKRYFIKTKPTQPSATVVGSGFVSWDSYAIFKDNDTRRDYGFGEMVSAMGGKDVGVVQPPFSILPQQDSSSIFVGCIGGPPVATEDVVIENIPYAFAIPMLTGWNVGYASCSGDHHVKEIGIAIDSWSYAPPSGGAGGTLRYTLRSILRDDGNDKPTFHSHKATVLGLRPQ